MMKRALLVGLMLAACGGDDSQGDTPDGGTSGDAAAPDAASSKVTLHLWDAAGNPVAGRAVAFLGPGGTTIAEVMTDATGTAAAPMPTGGSVTIAPSAIVGPGGFAPSMFTYLGVKNGDELAIGSPKRPAETWFDVTVSVPAGAVPTAQNFLFHSSCNLNAGNTTNARSVTMKIRSSCTTADFYVEALDGSYKPISSIFVTGKAVAAGAMVDVGSGFTALQTSLLLIDNVPSLSQITPALDQVHDGFYTKLTFNLDVTVTNGMASKTLVHGAVPGSSIETRVYLEGSGRRLVVRRSPAPLSATLDFAAEAIPDVVTRGAYSSTAHNVSWVESGTPTDVSAYTLRIKAGATRDFLWMVVGPHVGASLPVPTLPASFAPFAIATGDTVTVTSTTIAAFPGGYDRVRPLLNREVDGDNFSRGFLSTFDGVHQQNAFAHVVADGDIAVIATN